MCDKNVILINSDVTYLEDCRSFDRSGQFRGIELNIHYFKLVNTILNFVFTIFMERKGRRYFFNRLMGILPFSAVIYSIV